MGDGVVNEFIALFVFLKTDGSELGKKENCGAEERECTDLCRHLAVQI